MLKSRIQMLDVTYFLMDKFGYQRMNIINPDLDLWLVKNDSKKYPIIRLTARSLSDGIQQKSEILKQSKHISKVLTVNDSLLNIHFNDQSGIEEVSEDYKQALVNENYISNFLKNDFRGFETSLKPIKDNLEKELKRRELKILDLSNKPKEKQKFSLKMIGPTQIIVLINLLVFMGATFLEVKFGSSLAAILLGGLYKNFIYGANEWWRLIASGFLHVDLFHILMNMLVLFQAGAIVERVYGKKQMLVIYFTALITSSLLALIMMDGGTISLGASGGVFGLMGAIIVYLFTSDLYKIPKIRNQIFTTLLANILISLIPGISFYGHLGGFIGGVLISVAVTKAKKFEAAKVHAYISTALIIVVMFAYSLLADNNVYSIRPEVDKLSIQAVRELGFDGYANSLEKNMIIYYNKLGETYE